MKALIILNGDYTGGKLLQKLSGDADITICADGGARHAEAAGIPVDILLGDMDSYSGNTPKDSAVIKYPKEKDLTDGELALDQAIIKGARSIIITCAGGGRPDHFYGNLLLLERAAAKNIRCSIMTDKFEITLVKGKYTSKTIPGKLVSVLPYGGNFIYGMNTGMLYKIDNPVHVKAHEAFGISNETTSDFIEILISGGRALIFREL